MSAGDPNKKGEKPIRSTDHLNTSFFIVDPGDDAQTTICSLGESRVG